MQRILTVIALLLPPLASYAKPETVINFELGATQLLGSTGGVVVDAELGVPPLASVSKGFCARPCVETSECGGVQTCSPSRGYCLALPGASCDEDEDCGAGERCRLPFVIVDDPAPWSRLQLGMAVEQGRSGAISWSFAATSNSLDCMMLTLLGRCSNDNFLPCAGDGDCRGGTCGLGNGEVPIFATESRGGTRQCVVTIGCDDDLIYCPSEVTGSGGPGHYTRRRLRVYYNDEDQFECEESFTDGTHCATCPSADETCNPARSECPAEPGGVPKCSKATYGVLTLEIGERRHICIQTKNFLGSSDHGVQCTLYADQSALPDKGSVEVGGGKRPQGQCHGGSKAATACEVNGDCKGGGLCSDPSGVIADVAQARFGVLDSGKAVQDVFLRVDDITHFNLATTPSDLQKALDRRWLTSDIVSAAGTNTCAPTGCSSDHADCLDDVKDTGDGRADGNSTRLTCAQNETEVITHHPWPSPSPAAATLEGDSWVAVSFAVLEDSTTDRNKSVVYGITDGANIQSVTFDVNNQAEGDYAALPAAIFGVAADGSSRSVADYNDDDLYFFHAGDSGTSAQVRLTSSVQTIAYTLPTAVRARTFADVNDDGLWTVCYVNDSRWNGDDVGLTILELTPDVGIANVIGQSSGGRKIADFVSQVVQIAAGTSTYARAYRGSAGHSCDVLFVDAAINDWIMSYPREGRCYQPWCTESSLTSCSVDSVDGECAGGEKCRIGRCVKPCSVGSECTGTCGGPNHDGSCAVPSGSNWHRSETGGAAICVDGDRYGKPCRASAAQCQYCSGNKTIPCSTDSACAEAAAGTCIKPDFNGPCQAEIGGWCHQLDAYDAPTCSYGICLARTSQSYVRNLFRSMVDVWRGLAGSSRVNVVIAPTFGPAGGLPAFWSCNREEALTFNRWQKELAIEYGLAWADQEAWFQAQSPNRDAQYYPAQDPFGVHLSPQEGQPTLAAMFATCIRAEYHPAIDCRPILIPCDGPEDCGPGTTCRGWPIGTQAYCQIAE